MASLKMADTESDWKPLSKNPRKNLLEEWLASVTSCSATFWQFLLFEATFDFGGNLIKLLATYGNHKVL